MADIEKFLGQLDIQETKEVVKLALVNLPDEVMLATLDEVLEPDDKDELVARWSEDENLEFGPI